MVLLSRNTGSNIDTGVKSMSCDGLKISPEPSSKKKVRLIGVNGSLDYSFIIRLHPPALKNTVQQIITNVMLALAKKSILQ